MIPVLLFIVKFYDASPLVFLIFVNADPALRAEGGCRDSVFIKSRGAMMNNELNPDVTL
jgi:hypothetical protein